MRSDVNERTMFLQSRNHRRACKLRVEQCFARQDAGRRAAAFENPRQFGFDRRQFTGFENSVAVFDGVPL